MSPTLGIDMILRALYCLMVTQFLWHCGSSPAVTGNGAGEVQATGIAEIYSGQTGRARDDALEDAKRQAVGKVIGTALSSKTSVSSGVFEDQTINSNIDGFIQSYQILAEGKKSKDLYSVTIKATVHRGKIEEVLGQALATAGRPEFIVIVDQRGNLESDNLAMQIALEEAFIAKGYPLLDKQIVDQLRDDNKKLLRQLSAGDSRAAQDFGRAAGAQIIIFGKADFRNAGNVLNSSLKSIQLQSSIRIIDVTNGKLLASIQERSVKPHINPSTGGMLAAKEVAAKIEKKATPLILRNWQQNNAQPIEIVYTGLVYGEMLQFNDMLLRLRGVKELNNRGLRNKTTKLQVMFQGTSDILAERIYRQSSRAGFNAQIEEVKPNNIILSVKKAR